MALTLAQRVHDWRNIIDIMNSMGLIYYNLKQLDKSLASHRDALAVSISKGDSLSIAYMYNNVAMSHFELGRYDSSLYYNLKALFLKESLGLPRADQVANLNNIGEDYLELDSLELAEKYLSEANQLYMEGRNGRGQIICSTNLAKLAIKTNDYATAQSYLDIISQLFESVYVKDLYLDYVELKTELLEKQGRSNEALASHKELAALKEEVFQEELLEVQKVESAFLLREKELEAENHVQEAELARAGSRRNAQLTFFSVLALIMAVAATVIFFRLNRRLKESNRIIQLQKLDLKHSTHNAMMQAQALLRRTSESVPDRASKEKLWDAETLLISAAAL